jgi:hypothetical protein
MVRLDSSRGLAEKRGSGPRSADVVLDASFATRQLQLKLALSVWGWGRASNAHTPNPSHHNPSEVGPFDISG